MKPLNYLILILNCLLLLSFYTDTRTCQTECVTTGSDGYITIKIWDTKKGVKYNAEQARKDAINAILYSGISSSAVCNTQAPILNRTDAQTKFKKIEKNFFSKNGKWSFFTRSSITETSLPTSLSKNNWRVYQVSISKNELRKYLEDQNIIKSLNNGF